MLFVVPSHVFSFYVRTISANKLTLPFYPPQALQVEVQPHKNAPVHVMVAAAGGSEILDPGKATRIDPANTTLVPTDDTAVCTCHLGQS